MKLATVSPYTGRRVTSPIVDRNRSSFLRNQRISNDQWRSGQPLQPQKVFFGNEKTQKKNFNFSPSTSRLSSVKSVFVRRTQKSLRGISAQQLIAWTRRELTEKKKKFNFATFSSKFLVPRIVVAKPEEKKKKFYDRVDGFLALSCADFVDKLFARFPNFRNKLSPKKPKKTQPPSGNFLFSPTPASRRREKLKLKENT